MSGGRVGNVAHMLADVPDIATKKEIVIIAGTNDIMQDTETEEEFKDAVGKGVDLIHQQMFARTTQRLTMVAPLLPPDSHPIRLAKHHYLDKYLQELSRNDDFPFNYISHRELRVQMDDIHPTAEGTKSILHAIHDDVPIIVNETYITADRLYQGVEGVFKYGCLRCPAYLNLDDRYLCPKCLAPPDAPPILVEDVVMGSPKNARMSAGSEDGTPVTKKSRDDATTNDDV